MKQREHAQVWQFRVLIVVFGLLLTGVAGAQGSASESTEQTDEEYVRSNYSKHEYLVPMRDGVRLHTAVYAPYDKSRSYPILLFRTPYSCRPYGADQYRTRLGPNMRYARDGYIFVYQDVRGKYLSEGTFVNMRPHVAKKSSKNDIDESTDTFDTVDWLITNLPNHNDRVGQWGISYPGFYSAAGMIDSHPALKAVSPQAPIADWFWDDFHHHGALFLPHAFNFLSSFGRARPEPTTESGERFDHGTPDGYQFFLDLGSLKNTNEKHLKGEIDFWNQLAAHPNYDEFWQSRNLLPHLHNVKCAVLIVGGLFDAEDLYGPLKIYREVERNNPGTANRLVMGPWSHGAWNRRSGRSLGHADFGFDTSAYYRDNIEYPFFDHYLRGEGEMTLAEATVFETGANRWCTFDSWPPRNLETKRLFVGAGESLSFEGPAADTGGENFDEFISDPAKPVPFTESTARGMPRPYMTDDQRFASRRPDVLTYKTEVLTDDLTFAGPLQVDLYVSTSESAADWVVKLIDVLPPDAEDPDPNPTGVKMGGYQMMVRSEIMRGRFRNSYENPEPFEPGQVTKVSLELLDVLHTFKRGHRVMVQIQSSWFPLVDRNPQKYLPNIFDAEESDFIKATHRVYRTGQHATSLRVGVLKNGTTSLKAD